MNVRRQGKRIRRHQRSLKLQRRSLKRREARLNRQRLRLHASREADARLRRIIEVLGVPRIVLVWIVLWMSLCIADRRDFYLTRLPNGHSNSALAARRNRRGHGGDRPDRVTRAASYSRYSSDQQNAKSILQQQRACRIRAKQEELSLLAEFEYSDAAISGTKLRRDGLDRLLAGAEQGLFGTVYFHDLGRLARENTISMAMLKRLVFVSKIRVVSVTEGVDSDNEGWDTLATILGLHHEQYIKNLSANVLRGLVQNLLDGWSVGDLCFGYTSIAVAGADGQRHGRNAEPKKLYAIDESEADWVKKIFRWFVDDSQPIAWIIRELNRRGAPRDHRVRGRRWSRAGVIGILRRTKFIGVWPWGEFRNERNPLTGQVTQQPRSQEETQAWVRHFPDLLIIDIPTFERAQEMLDENAKNCADHRDDSGRLNGSSRDAANPRHLLQGRIKCAECGSTFYVGGARGQYLSCPGHRDGVCSCRTMLSRKLAERLILGEISRRIFCDPAWRKACHTAALDAWNAFESTVPVELASVQRQLSELDQKVRTLVDQIEKGLDEPEVQCRLAERRTEREELDLKLKRLKRESDNRPQKPTVEWIDHELAELHKTLESGTPAAAIALGSLIGTVVVREVVRTGRKRTFVRGEFVMRAEPPQKHFTSLIPDNSNVDRGEIVIIDFVEVDPRMALSESVKQLSDEGLGNWEIAERLQLRPARVTYLWSWWWTSRGLAVPDRRNRPKRTLKTTPRYQQIADETKRLWDAGESERAIAKKLETTDGTVRNAIEWWHESRGLPVPRFSDRRKKMIEQVADMYHGGTTLEAIANVIGRSVASVCDLLDDWYAARGEKRPDGRSQKRKKAS